MRARGTPDAGNRGVGGLALLAVPAALLIGGVVAILVTRGDATATRAAYLVDFLSLEVLGIVAGLYAGLRRGEARPIRRVWVLLAVSFMAMVAFGAVFGAAADGAVSPAAATALMLAARVGHIAALMGALLSFPTRARSRRDRAKLAFELATAAGGGFMLVWYFVVGPALASPSVALTTLLFPVADLMVLTGVFAVLLRGVTPGMRGPLLLLLLGLGLFFGCNLYSSHRAVTEPGYIVSPLETSLVLLGLALMIAAVGVHCLRPAGTATPTDGPAAPPTMNRLPYVALAVGYGVLVVAAVKAGLYPWLGLVAGAIVMTAGIAARQIAALRDNHELAVTDALTGLANRARVHQWLRKAAERSRRADHQIGVLLIDLDGFKQVNDGHGHEAGDRLLVTFADVLRASVRAGDIAGRLGGDEFAVVLQRTTVADAVGIADRILAAAAATPALIAGHSVAARASIGIAVSAARAPVDPDDLLHQADVAMYRAKRRSGHGWELYDPVDALGQGRNRQISYRSVVGLETGRRVAVQAVLPADETGLLEHACRQVLALRAGRPEDRDLCLSIPIPAEGVARPSLATDLERVLARTGFPPAALILEATADELTADSAPMDQLTRLRALGIRVALDVSGCASLPRLSGLPVDVITLGRCVVGELDRPHREETVAVAEAIVRFRIVEPTANEVPALQPIPAR